MIAGQLARNGWDVRVVTRAGTLTRFRLHRAGGLKVVEVPGFNRRRLGAALFMITAMILGIWWGFRSRAFVAIQLMSTSTAAGLCGLLLRRPFLAMSTTSGALSESVYIRSTRLSGIRVRLLGSATRLVAQTDEVARELTELTGNLHVTVLPNPVAVIAPPPLNGRPEVLFTGRFSDEKDLPVLLSAWEDVLESEPGAKLTLAGAGGMYRSVEPEVRAIVSQSAPLRDSVSLPGWLDDVTPLLTAADVFVFPSREEGMSNALLEACAHGRLVVASDIPANRVILGETYPLYFAVGARKDLAECLIAALRMEEDDRAAVRAQLADRMRAFSTETVVSRLEELIAAADRTRH